MPTRELAQLALEVCVKEFEVTLAARNNRLKTLRLQAEPHLSQRAFARRVGVSPQLYNSIETMRLSPLRLNGGWREIAVVLAEYHNVELPWLFPAAVRAMKRNKATVTMDVDELTAALAPPAPEPMALPADIEDQYNLKRVAMSALEQLPRRDQAVLSATSLAHGKPMTYTELGAKIGVSRERARQIQARAEKRWWEGMRKLDPTVTRNAFEPFKARGKA